MAETTYRVLVFDTEHAMWRDFGTRTSYSKAAVERTTIEAFKLEEGVPVAVIPESYWEPVAKQRKPDPQYEIKPWDYSQDGEIAPVPGAEQ